MSHPECLHNGIILIVYILQIVLKVLSYCSIVPILHPMEFQEIKRTSFQYPPWYNVA